MGLGKPGPGIYGLGDHIFLIGIEAYLGVDYDSGVIGVVNHDIGDHGLPFIVFYLMSPAVRDYPLGEEMHTFHQTGVLKHVREQHFTEISLNLRIPGQGIGQVTSLVSDGSGMLQDILDVLFHRGALGRAFLLGFPDAPVEFLEFLLYGFQKLRDRIGALVLERSAGLSRQGLEGILHALQFLLMLFFLQPQGLLLLGFQPFFVLGPGGKKAFH